MTRNAVDRSVKPFFATDKLFDVVPALSNFWQDLRDAYLVRQKVLLHVVKSFLEVPHIRSPAFCEHNRYDMNTLHVRDGPS